MRRLVLLAAFLVAGIAPAHADSQATEQVERGRYLAIVGDCVACHTAPGGAPFAGGLPIATPFGTMVSPNITPDTETGIGAWSDDSFLRAFRKGIGRSGEHLYPAFPYQYYTKVSTPDALAIRAWLRTLAPVRHAVVANQLPFPFDIRADMIAWNLLNFTPGRFAPNPGKSDQWNTGAYLVEGLGHCAACHTEKSFLGGDKTSSGLQGGVLDSWFAPNITGDPRRGLGGWTVAQIVTYLQTGHNDVAAASGPMGEVVDHSTSHMTTADLQAMAVYLKDRPPQPDEAPPSADPATVRLGAAIYTAQCSACHAASGAGIGGLFPTLAHAPSVQSASPVSLIRVVLQGARSVSTDPAPTGAAMPSFGWKLSDDQIAAVLTYLRVTWGNLAAPVAAGDVATLRRAMSP